MQDDEIASVLNGANKVVVLKGKRLTRQGDAHMVWIPKQYVKDGIIDPDFEYDVYFIKKPKNLGD